MRASLAVAVVVIAGCGGQPASVAVSGAQSASGWEVRYNATMALARRGSPKFLDPVVQELMNEMLNEAQQLRNFRNILPDGREVGDPQAARAAMIGAMKAVAEYHNLRPADDVSGLKPALTQLAAGENRVVAAEAKSLLEALSK